MGSAARTVLVTGANRGLGLETCRQLAQQGWRVLLTSRDAGLGAAAIARLAEQGLAAEYRVLDVTDTEALEELAQSLSKHGDLLDALVCNAGIAMKGFDAEIARKTIDVNFLGALEVVDALVPIVRDGSNVVMVSSGLGELSGLAPHLRARFEDPALERDELIALVEGFVRDVELHKHASEGWPSSAYRVSKIAMNALTRILARELAPRHIRVNAVCPGWVRTDLGGPHAERSVEQGARSIVWGVNLDDDTTGGFFRDGHRIPW
jgi:NAD(P)-dependent dehydrogenase (short-subunit alcohol dehydrogenase family)